MNAEQRDVLRNALAEIRFFIDVPRVRFGFNGCVIKSNTKKSIDISKEQVYG